MKIQELAIIFVIIILPISIVLSVYTQFQIQTLNTQTLYDTKLTTATYDAIKAFQINTANSTMSDLSNSKLRDIEASVATFKNSIMSTFGLNGYTEQDLNNFIPALVYTMYDGFYIYSPYENTNHLYEYKYEDDGHGNLELKKDSNGNPIYNQDDEGNLVPLDNNGETIYGLKPYITYSCRYKYPINSDTPDIDVVITYSLDNYITVQGMIEDEYVNKDGYLIDGIEINSTTGAIKYNGVEIGTEALTEYVDGVLYPYAKINGTKYYYDKKNASDPNDDEIFYISNGKRVVQIVKNRTETQIMFGEYTREINNNDSAIKYYRDAKIFTDWVKEKLSGLKYKNAYEIVYEEQTNGTWQYVEKQLFTADSEYANLMEKTLFIDNSNNIENDLSNFNLHRQEIIRHKIESNLSIAIANYNYYSLADGIEFQLPELKEEEWDFIINNVSLISFVQGLDIGGKLYNGYTIVNNSETKEVIQEENIYILGNDNYYHKIGDIYLETDTNIGGNIGGTNISPKSAGRANLDFEKKKIIRNDNSTIYYYPLKNFFASYNSIITQNNVTTFNDIYAYIQDQKNKGNVNLAKAFYTALGRERYGMYKHSNEGIYNYNTLFVGYSSPDHDYESRVRSITYDLNQLNGINATYVYSKDSNYLKEYVKLQKNNYKLIVINSFAWPLPLTATELQEISEATNLITISNDATNLPMMESWKTVNNSTVTPELTPQGETELGQITIDSRSDSSQAAIIFKDDVEVLCKGTYNGGFTGIGDVIGVWKKGSYKWTHSQLMFNYGNSNDMDILFRLVNLTKNAL